MFDSIRNAWAAGVNRSLHGPDASSAVPAQDSSAAGALAQATPIPKIDYLFVQTAKAGSFTPKPGDPDLFQITLQGAAAHTVYVSDRPDRIAGTVSMDQFLDGLGFTPSSPPNAAVIAQTDTGEEVVVVELMNPIWDEADSTLTYDVQLLDQHRSDAFKQLSDRALDAELPDSFGHTSLFIDDCREFRTCWSPGLRYVGSIPGGVYTGCFEWRRAACVPCSGLRRRDLRQLCNEAFAECRNACILGS